MTSEIDLDKKGPATTMPGPIPKTTLQELDVALSKFNTELQKTYGGVADAPFTPTADTPAPEPFVGKPSKKEYLRPSGERYLPRRIKVGQERFTDVAFIEKSYKEKMPVLLSGPPGTGKTALVEAALDNVITIVGNVETEIHDFVGGFVQDPTGLYSWVDGPLVVAAEKGFPFLIDEIAQIDPRVMSAAVYSLMDGRRELNVTQNPERGVVKAKEGFAVYGTMNPDTPGSILSDALISRFTLQVDMQTDWSIAKRLDVPDKIVQVARNLANKAKTGEIVSAPQLREVLAFRDTAKAFGQDVAIANFLSGIRPEDQVVAKDAVNAIFGGRQEILTF